MNKELYHYNHNHDPKSGRFTFSKGGNSSSGDNLLLRAILRRETIKQLGAKGRKQVTRMERKLEQMRLRGEDTTEAIAVYMSLLETKQEKWRRRNGLLTKKSKYRK